MPGRAPSYLVAGLGLAVAVALFLVGGRASDDGPSPALTRVASDVDARLREMRAALRSRASTLGDLPRLAVAVATDAATVQDLTTEELAFRLKPGETIEIAHVKDGETISLLRMPRESKAAPALDKPGTTVTAAEGGFLLSEVVSITPAVQTGVERGALAVSWFLDAKTMLDGVTIPARIEMGGKAIAAGAAAFTDGVATTRIAVPGELAAGATVVGQNDAAVGAFSPLRLAGFVVGGVALVLALAMGLRKPRPAGASSSPITANLPPVGSPISPLGAGSSGRAASLSQEMPGMQFGRYSVVRKLGSGGMAEVYLANVAGEAGFNKDVALKIMHRNLAQMPEVVDHFLDEARLASRLSHPNIVQIHDLGKSGDDYFIAMEYIDGYDLDYLLDKAQARGALVPVRVVLAITRKLCLGLEAAHTAVAADGTPLDIVHRDVKAENVLISKKGEVKIADFGIAKANQRSRITQFGMVKGTAAYMAPEHRVGRPVNRRADVYGVGAVFYELMTGREINLDLENLAHLGREGWPHLMPISQIRADVSAEVDAIVAKTLAFDREDRYATCAALEDELENFAVRHGVEAGDKAIVHWMEEQMAHLEGRAPLHGGLPSRT